MHNKIYAIPIEVMQGTGEEVTFSALFHAYKERIYIHFEQRKEKYSPIFDVNYSRFCSTCSHNKQHWHLNIFVSYISH